MKKRLSALIPLILLLAGCGGRDVPKIDEYTWEMTSVQSIEENGQAVAYGERGHSILADAVQLDMDCVAENGVLTVTDHTNQITYTGTYRLRNTDPRAVSYDIVLDGKEGIAVAAMTTYHDGAHNSTFIMNLEDYAINFFAAEE